MQNYGRPALRIINKNSNIACKQVIEYREIHCQGSVLHKNLKLMFQKFESNNTESMLRKQAPSKHPIYKLQAFNRS